MNRLTDTARILAASEHRAAGGSGEPPADLVTKHAAALALECEAQQAQAQPQARQAPAIQPTNGLHPEDGPHRSTHDPRPLKTYRTADGPHRSTHDPRPLKTYRTADGHEVRAFQHGQNLADFSPRKSNLSLEQVGEIFVAQLTGKPLTGMEEQCRAMSEGLSTGGGFLVPEVLSDMVIDRARAKSRVMAAGVQVIPMTSESLNIARVSSDPTFGVYSESTAISLSTPAFNSISLRARKIGCAVAASRELLEDAPNAGAVLIDLLTSALASKLDDLMINGSGVGGEFMGLLNDPQIHETTGVGQLSYDDLLDAVGYIRGLNGEPNGILLNPSTVTWLAKLKESSTLAYLKAPEALAPFPYLDSTAIANTSLIVGDFREALFGLRQSVMIEMTNDASDAFLKHETWVKITMRGGFNLARPMFERLEGLTY